MPELTVGKPPKYKCSPDDGNFKFPNGTDLTVDPPSEGCTLCFSVAVDGNKQHNIAGGAKQDIPFSGFSNGTNITYTAQAYETPCTGNPTAETTHTITIDDSMGGALKARATTHTITVDSN